MSTHILGVSAFYHDAAAALLRDGVVVAAAQEERFSRKKHDPAFPSHAVTYCLEAAGIDTPDLDHVAFYDKPFTKFERLLTTYLGVAPGGLEGFLTAMPVWLTEKLFARDQLAGHLEGYRGEVLFGEHHESHAASAFYPSPFDEAAVLTVDGVGEWATTMLAHGKGHQLDFLEQVRFPHSLGLLYSAFTYYTGFKVNSGEYKLMGLAPYGEPRFADAIREHLVDLAEDGSFWMNPEHFAYMRGVTMTSARFHELFGGPPRQPEGPLTQREMDLAASVQVVVEEAMLRLARHARARTGARHLCLAGGVALNCVANGRILREGIFDEIWVQPAAGDAGGALGVAYAVWHRYLGKPRAVSSRGDSQRGSLLGPSFTTEECRAFLERIGCPYREAPAPEWGDQVAALLEQGKVVGVLQGPMEFGPRALGGRSILGDPRDPAMQSTMNRKIKFRESFRPFAPAVLREQVGEYFDLEVDSPYMLLVAPVAASQRLPVPPEAQDLVGFEKRKVLRSKLPAVTHVDGSARVQTVTAEANPGFHRILAAFQARTGCGVLVNTSFNVRGEPIVCTPEDAYRCFRRTEMDALVLENLIVEKGMELPAFGEARDWREEFELD